ncbi:hypothetical protein COOONC_05079, partial [Cooperia oncophora]
MSILEFQAASDISEHVVARIRALGENGSPESLRKLEEQLEKCFDLFPLPQFRNIVLENLKQLPKLQDRYLDSIMNDRDFYDACPLSVKQQIWLRNLDLFKEAYKPSIDSYLKRKEDFLLSTEPMATNFFTFETTKARRQWKEIKDLIMFVGNHEELFLAVMTYIRELFASTDSCHDFAWVFGATCMRAIEHLESAQIHTALRHPYLDTFPKLSSTLKAVDLAMVAGDVHVIHFLCSVTIRKLRDSAGAHMPRDMHSVVVLVRVLSLGCCAKDLALGKVLPTEVVDSIFITKFLPEFTSLMVEDCIRAELMRTNSDLGEEY